MLQNDSLDALVSNKQRILEDLRARASLPDVSESCVKKMISVLCASCRAFAAVIFLYCQQQLARVSLIIVRCLEKLVHLAQLRAVVSNCFCCCCCLCSAKNLYRRDVCFRNQREHCNPVIAYCPRPDCPIVSAAQDTDKSHRFLKYRSAVNEQVSTLVSMHHRYRT